MGCIAVTLFLGISYLATATNVVAFEGMPRTVTAQIALAVFGIGFGFYAVQVVTALILILAANTAYADFPRLSSVLTGDRFLPRQFAALGDRLVFSNGALVLAVAASLLLIVFDADVTQLIQLYVVGVFTSFTLSQAGMVRHWLKTQERNWRRSMVVNRLRCTQCHHACAGLRRAAGPHVVARAIDQTEHRKLVADPLRMGRLGPADPAGAARQPLPQHRGLRARLRA